MTDGPFRNLNLGARWKRFADTMLSEADSISSHSSLASHALIHDILTIENKNLLAALIRYISKQQLDIDPLGEINKIFNAYDRSPFADLLQKALSFRLYKQIPITTAFDHALFESIKGWGQVIKSRIEEESILLYQNHKIGRKKFDLVLEQLRNTFSVLSIKKIHEAASALNKVAFKEAVSKQSGIDDGPSL